MTNEAEQLTEAEILQFTEEYRQWLDELELKRIEVEEHVIEFV